MLHCTMWQSSQKLPLIGSAAAAPCLLGMNSTPVDMIDDLICSLHCLQGVGGLRGVVVVGLICTSPQHAFALGAVQNNTYVQE
jgi:hypothetical protein